jgi:hypothetical protein
LKGTPIYSPEPVRIREESTDASLLPATFNFDNEWATNVNTAQSFADVLLAYFEDPKEYPEITIYNRPSLACDIDLEERLRLQLDTFDIDKTFFVNKISHRSGRTMQEIISTVKIHPMLQDQGTTVLIFDSTDRGILGSPTSDVGSSDYVLGNTFGF